MQTNFSADDATAKRVTDELLQLTRVYRSCGKPQEVLALVNQTPWWVFSDIEEALASEARERGYGNNGTEKSGRRSLWVNVAWALFKTGQTQDALKVIDAVLEYFPGDDGAYELLLEIEGDGAMKRLEAIFAGDRFEKRPLIWKAQLLLNQKKLDDAEAVARQAIAIDPADGLQAPGDRMRAFSVLRDILVAKGRDKEAQPYANLVQAIRLAERADREYEAGLTSRAISTYQRALALYGDAYCIQSRLALRLLQQGQEEQAKAHFKRAYELMPDSFGRIESHCLECAETHVGNKVAEQVFADLAKTASGKPQVHFLRGKLVLGRKEALAAFQEAVRLDPDYLNAWVEIAKLSNESGDDSGLTEWANFEVYRLDPGHKHSSVSLSSPSDYKALWDLIATNPPPVRHRGSGVYRLASAAREPLENLEPPEGEAAASDAPGSPRSHIGDTNVFRYVGEIMDSQR